MNDTTRRFHRTIDQAFPHGPIYASSVEHYRRGEPRWAVLLGCFAVGCTFAALLLWGVS